MTPYQAFCLYIAIKNHFTLKTYDYFKYHGKSQKVTLDNYNQRNDKWIFEKLSKRPDLKGFLVANFVSNPRFWIGDTETCEKNYAAKRKVWESQSYIFENEIRKLDKSIKELIEVKDHNIPHIINEYLSGQISLETLTIFSDVVGCYSYWSKQLKGDDVIWDHFGLLIKKYRPFLQYDKKKYLSIVKKYCNTSANLVD